MSRCRLCISYIVSSLLIGTFIFSLIRNNLHNDVSIRQLRKEIDDITEMMLHGGQDFSGEGENREPRQLDEIIDLIVRKRMGFVMDDLYTLKQQLEIQGCLANIPDETGKGIETIHQQKVEEFVNFASTELGARIVSVDADPLCPSNFLKTLFGLKFASNPPIKMLESSIEPGSCFAFKPDEAKVLVKLPYPIFINKVGIQHIGKQQSPTEDVRSAPRDFTIYGYKSHRDTELGMFQYENKPNELFQLFEVKLVPEKFEYLRIHFFSNHGHENYTCIYRLTVHGRLQ